MKCLSCGAELGNNRFCTMCGRPVGNEMPSNPNGANRVMNNDDTMPLARNIQQEESGNKNKGLIILVCSLGGALVITLLVICLVFMNMNFGDAADDTTAQESEETVVVDVPPVEEPAPFERMSTYRPTYSYARMSDVHSSYESNDETANDLSDEITDFNNAWIDFVNNGNNDVYRYVKSGTKVYENVESYGKKNIHEEFVLMDINDVRQNGSYYFVWTHEIIRVRDFNTGAVEEKEYHWVYRVSETGGSYYVEDYSYDPAYK